jgi:gluconolactonase
MSVEAQLIGEPLFGVDALMSFSEGLDHPEGLAFDDEQQLWAGGELGQVYKIDPRGRAQEITRLGGFCLGVTVSASQELWICNSGLHVLMQVDRGGRVIAEIGSVNGMPLQTPNFSVFDHDRNLYFSDSGSWNQLNGCVYRIRGSGKSEYFAGPFAFANGLALSADDRFLFVVESQRDRVLRIPIRENGTADQPEVYISGLARIPDGLALDAQGDLYVTCYATDCIYRVTPDRDIRLLAFDPEATRLSRPTNAAFGGPSLEDLYVANFGRWHISRIHLGRPGQRLTNL